MSEEKIRNMKSGMGQAAGSENIPSFLLKTYEILEVTERSFQNPKYSEVICWTKNGEGFVVKRVKEFAENILPTHFRHSNYTSFVRQVTARLLQLNMYDFHKTRQENQENAFKNAMFKRGQKHLLKQIQRKDYKKKKEKSDSVHEKSGVLPNQVEPKADKKVQVEKQFYSKTLLTLEKMAENVQRVQSDLANVETIQQTDDGICFLLEQIMNVRSTNSSLLLTARQIQRDWDILIANNEKILKANTPEEQEDERKEKENPDPTFHTFNTFAHKELE